MVYPRDAATVILARPTPGGGYEVLLTRRPDSMRFMGGLYVFPGGALDDDDCGEPMLRRSALTRERAGAALGEELPAARALGLYCCAIREAFEEVGVLLARTASGEPVDPDVVEAGYVPRRDAVAGDGASFARFLGAEDLVLTTDQLVPYGRLITPEMSPIRFDARFFVAPYPSGQRLSPDPREVPEVLWIAPAEAIRAASEERLAVPIPTMAILQGLTEVPGYPQLLRGGTERRQVESAALSPLVSSVLAPNPGLATGAGTNTYVVGRGECAIIDPAVPDPVFIEMVTRDAGNRGRPTLVLLTHLHPDHVGGAAILASQLGCEVGAWEGVAAQTPFVTRAIHDGDEFTFGEATLRAHHTPGHASHHLCFELLEERALFAGDVVAGAGTVVIAPPDGDMAHYIQTLERLRTLDISRIYPGHGPVIEDGPAKLTGYLEHRRQREAEVLDALAAGCRDVPAMVERIYADVPEALHQMAEMSVLAHLQMLEGQGRVRRTQGTWHPAG